MKKLSILILFLTACAPGPVFYASWSCAGYQYPNQQAQCAQALGAANGIAGPFPDMNSCNAWLISSSNQVYNATGNLYPYNPYCYMN